MSNSTSGSITISANDVLQCLSTVIDAASGEDVVSAGMISGITVKHDKVGFLITIDPKQKDSHAWLREACEKAVLLHPAVASVTAVLTSHNAEPIAPTKGGAYTAPRERAVWNLTPLEHVKCIVAVASGKGGVGKSTVASHLVMTMAHQGLRVGLLDADIYGPSLPTMFGLAGQPQVIDGKMQPMLAHGVKCMSMGLITGDEAAILRGPMISKSLQQMLRLTRWGTKENPLDVLLIDMPPGTGDVHLSLVQQVPLSGVVLVTTPQTVALKDARKCAQMFEKVGIKILGVVENMSYLSMPDGGKQAIFGNGGGAMLADEYRCPLLCELPIAPRLVEICDRGGSLFNPPDVAEISSTFTTLATRLRSQIC